MFMRKIIMNFLTDENAFDPKQIAKLCFINITKSISLLPKNPNEKGGVIMKRLVKILGARYSGILVLELTNSDSYVYPYSCSCPSCSEACNKGNGENISASVSSSWPTDIQNSQR